MSPIADRFRILVVSIAVVTGALLFPQQAAAENWLGNGVYVVAAVALPVAVADVVFTGYDLDRAIEGERASNAMAATEIAVAMPQAVLGSVAMAFTEKVPWPLTTYTVWMWGLSLHGLITLAKHPTSPDPIQPPTESDPNKVRVSLAPMMVSNGSQLVPGLGAVGRF